jgi:hypothetical protein
MEARGFGGLGPVCSVMSDKVEGVLRAYLLSYWV